MYKTALQVPAVIEPPENVGIPLDDRGGNGKARPWREKKVANELLSAAYEQIDPHKAQRLRDCATFATFRREEGGRMVLESANFCRVRLCPVCTWRRSLKTQAQMIQVLQYMEQQPQRRAWLFVTLTSRNVTGDKLTAEIDKYMQAYHRLMGCKAIKQAVKGWYRALEVTHNLADDTYHPHLHCLWAVSPSYFHSRDYISFEAMVALWRRSMRLDYNPSIAMRALRKDNSGGYLAAIVELSRYTTKAEEYLIPDDWDLTVDSVRVLDEALHNRRFVAYGGEIAQVRRKLQQDDVETGDLVHVDGEQPPAEEGGKRIMFLWYSGYRQYYGREQ